MTRRSPAPLRLPPVHALDIVIIVVVAVAIFVLGALVWANQTVPISEVDEIDRNAYWSGYYVSCIQVAQMQESTCYSLTQTERAK